jgi:hypothetical protein
MCSQPTKLSTAFPDRVLDTSVVDDQLLVLQAKPIPSRGDMYLAKHYNFNLISVFPQKSELLSLGQGDMTDLWKIAVQPVANQTVLIFSSYWKAFSLNTKTWLSDIGPPNANRRSAYSPDLNYYVACEPSAHPHHFTLYRTIDGQRLFASPKLAEVYSMTWSRDSRKLAVVALPVGVSSSAYRENLFVYSVH